MNFSFKTEPLTIFNLECEKIWCFCLPEKRKPFDWQVEHRDVLNRFDEWFHIFQDRVNKPILLCH